MKKSVRTLPRLIFVAFAAALLFGACTKRQISPPTYVQPAAHGHASK